MSLDDSRLKERGIYVLQTEISWRRILLDAVFFLFNLRVAALLPRQAIEGFGVVVYLWFAWRRFGVGSLHTAASGSVFALKKRSPDCSGLLSYCGDERI